MIIDSIERLEAIYRDAPTPASTVKEIDHISPEYAALIAASPFVALATAGPEGLDCSPRGDVGRVVQVLDPKTLLLPDRRGNNRIDSLRNIIRDARVALLFLIPGSGTTFRVNGRARITADPEVLASLAIQGQPPRTAILISVETAYFQCARAVIRAGLWDPARYVDPSQLPTAGAILASVSAGEVGGRPYDEEWPERAAKSLW